MLSLNKIKLTEFEKKFVEKAGKAYRMDDRQKLSLKKWIIHCNRCGSANPLDTALKILLPKLKLSKKREVEQKIQEPKLF